MSDFPRAFQIVIGEEGGYVNNPADPGGETKYGISKRAYPTLDIANLTVADAQQIYQRDYWDRLQGDELPYPVNVLVFDAAVNQGLGEAIRLLQKAVGVGQDGALGAVTFRAVRDSLPQCVPNFQAVRAIRYAESPEFNLYGKGWMARLFTVLMKVSGGSHE